MKKDMNRTCVSREEILIALGELNEDPTASRADVLLKELEGVKFEDHGRADTIRHAVAAARERLDAPVDSIVDPHALPFMTVVGTHVLIHDAHSGDPLNSGWIGICVDSRDVKSFWYIGHDMGERSYTKLVQTTYEDAFAEVAELGVLAASSVRYCKPIGYQLGGFVVGHRARMSGGSGDATIVDLRADHGGPLVTLEFEEPQVVDWPVGALAQRMEIGFEKVASTWTPNDGSMRRAEKVAGFHSEDIPGNRIALAVSSGSGDIEP
ncbi:hypothetical protein [Burkholderia sp. Tr-20390]|uniref:hypothetical protein n=1 Tax=Burkholderia sp. Tr-20390 TaxID=2703904 RepID=UPI00197E1A92|nr:hypothetical protein [Burkholderia sp. Tr-20390]MBN3729515.1 hypothetical protein [Burkholderia sp. Tr-20390]